MFQANPKAAKTSPCQQITEYLKRPTLKAELLFVISSAKVFPRFTETFQRDEPMVHLLYSELRQLFTTLALSVSKRLPWRN